MFKCTNISLLLVLALGLPGVYAQDTKVYKWKNAEGKMEYSQQPPEDESIQFEVETVKIKTKDVQSGNLNKDLPLLTEKVLSEKRTLKLKEPSKLVTPKQDSPKDD